MRAPHHASWIRPVAVVLFTVLCASFLVSPDLALAAKKKKKKLTIVQPSDMFTVDVSIKSGRKTLNQEFHCYRKQPGRITRTKRGLAFNSLANELKKMRAAGRNRTKKYKDLAKMQKAAAKQCNSPRFLALGKYSGQFGPREAALLFERFAFGASPQQIQRAVQIGLDATVRELTSYIDEPTLNAQFEDISCDTYLANNPWNQEPDDRNETCNAANPNDLNRGGMRRAVMWRMAYSANPFHHRLWMWLHDERLSVSSRVLGGDENHALRTYVGIVDRASRTGNYEQYMRELNSDHLMALDWLDGASNRGYNPNENWAREFWELGTVGASDLDGRPVYSSYDIAQAALAHSGWIFVSESREFPGEQNEQWFKAAAFSPAFHSPGPKTIFSGTPYAATVYSAEDLLRATFNHPRTAESLAEDMCHQFLRPDCPAVLVKNLAKIIRAEPGHNLIPAFRKLMTSQAMFAPENRKSLIKHPFEMLIGFLRQTGYRLDPDELNWYADGLDQNMLDPDTVFGWNERVLAGESYVLSWRNILLDIINGYNNDELIEHRAFDLHSRFLWDNPNSLTTIDRVASSLNITLNDAQRASLDQFMNFYQTTCQNWHVNQYRCTVGQLFLERDPFDSFPQGDWQGKLRALIGILGMLPDYRLK